MSTALKVRLALSAILAVLALSLLTPVIDHAGAATNKGGGSKVTCGAGSSPGDVETYNTYTYVNGNLASKQSISSICGKDGQWHIVAPRTVHHHASRPGPQLGTVKQTG
jgi:hypothetical protein